MHLAFLDPLATCNTVDHWISWSDWRWIILYCVALLFLGANSNSSEWEVLSLTPTLWVLQGSVLSWLLFKTSRWSCWVRSSIITVWGIISVTIMPVLHPCLWGINYCYWCPVWRLWRFGQGITSFSSALAPFPKSCLFISYEFS